MKDYERRDATHFGDLELRVRRDDEGTKLVGLAVPYESWSMDLGGFRERFARGAFTSLDDADIVVTFQHDDSMILGRTPRTARLVETDKGLHYEVDLPDTLLARDLVTSIERGDVRGNSFEFFTQEDTWDDEAAERTVNRATLRQVGPVTHPAYPQTDIAVRSRDVILRHAEETEQARLTRERDARARRLRLVSMS